MIYHNGIFVKQASISITHPAFLFGDGIFATILVDEGRIYFFSDHIKRLNSHLKTIRIQIPKIEKSDVYKLIEKNNAKQGLWRLKIIVIPNQAFLETTQVREVSDIFYFLQKTKRNPKKEFSLCSYQTPFVYPLANIKTLAYLSHQLVRGYAVEKGFDDALTFDQDQNILEASFANIFWIENNIFYYPEPSLPYLMGITLTKILEVAKGLGYEIKPGKYRLEDVKSSMSIFLVSSIEIIKSVIKIDNKSFKRDVEMEKTFLDGFLKLNK